MRLVSCCHSIYDLFPPFERSYETVDLVGHPDNFQIIGEVFKRELLSRSIPSFSAGPDTNHLQLIDAMYQEGLRHHGVVPASLLVKINSALIYQGIIFSHCDGELIPLYEMMRPCDRNQKTNAVCAQFCATTPVVDEHIDGSAIYIGSRGSFNYGHWLVDDLPRLAAIEKLNLGNLTTLFSSYNNRIDEIRQFGFQLFPEASPKALNLNKVYAAQDLFYVTPVSYHPKILSPSGMKFVQSAIPKIISKTGDKIFVNRRRKAFGQRILLNENEILEHLRSHGFEEVFPEDFNVIEQANIFRAATHVIGIMGAAMANTIFCKESTRVLYLAPNGWIEPFFWNISCVNHTIYGVIFGNKPTDLFGQVTKSHFSDFSVEISSIQEWLLQ